MALVVPSKVSGNSATVQHMDESLSLSTQWAGVTLPLPELQVGIMGQSINCCIKDKSHLL